MTATTISSTFQFFPLYEYWKKGHNIIKYYIVGLFLQDISGILKKRAAQWPYSLFNPPTRSPRRRTRFLLGKTVWFLLCCCCRQQSFALPHLLEQTFLIGSDLRFGSALLAILVERNLPTSKLAILPTHATSLHSAVPLQDLATSVA